ncbi:MAG: hypothetical protein J6K28_07950 [Alistipes sp.]|nr:hypothetical protein [Alistipes sp.]
MRRTDYFGYVSPSVRPYDVSIERGIAASVESDTTLEDVGDEKIDVWG